MESLANADFQVFGGLAVNQLLKQGSRLENCREASCYQEIARSLGVEYLVNGEIKVDRKNYDVTLELIAGRDGKRIDKYNEPCQLCGIKEVATKLDQLVQAVRRGAEGAAATAPARYAVESRPAGAEVSVDGRSAGTTPLSVDLTAGSHKLTVRAPGYDGSERTVNVESGTNGVVAVDLAPAGGISAAARGPSRMLAWTALALGAVAIGVGVVALQFNGEYLGVRRTRCLHAAPKLHPRTAARHRAGVRRAVRRGRHVDARGRDHAVLHPQRLRAVLGACGDDALAGGRLDRRPARQVLGQPSSTLP